MRHQGEQTATAGGDPARARLRLARADIASAVWGPTVERRRGDDDLNPAARRGRALNTGNLRPAAVLCGLVERAAGVQVILTRRADHLARHAGQIAFPGGKVDAADPSPLAAALREADEEIGLTRDEVEILGAIDPYETSSGYTVTPFVGFVRPSFTPIADPSEVAEVFEVPLDFLMDEANHQLVSKDLGRGTRRFYAMPYRDRYVWGATAGMLRNLSDRLSEVGRRRVVSSAEPA